MDMQSTFSTTPWKQSEAQRTEASHQACTMAIFQAVLEYHFIRQAQNPDIVTPVQVLTLETIRDVQRALAAHAARPDIGLPDTLLSDPQLSDVLVTEALCCEVKLSCLVSALERHRPQGCSLVNASPLYTAFRFSKAAAATLTIEEISLLIDWMSGQRHENWHPDTGNVKIQSILNEFYNAEVKLTKLPREDLAAPSGPEDAEIGIILHVQSTTDPISGFWEGRTNPTIQLLLDAGLSEQFVYAFDWHWRAEKSARRPNNACCPTLRWPRDQRMLHDRLSENILESLSLPWLLVGGACAVNSYRKTLSPQARMIKLPFTEMDNMRFEIDFRSADIRRIALYVPHPSAGWFNSFQAIEYGQLLDTSINFILWLHGKENQGKSVEEKMSQARRRVPGQAPMREIYYYRDLEETLGKPLNDADLHPDVLQWLNNYLRNTPPEFRGRGKSTIADVTRQFSQRISDARARHVEKYGFHEGSKLGLAANHNFSYKKYWHGETVFITQKGFFSVFPDIKGPPLQLFGGTKLYSRTKRTGQRNQATILFCKDRILLRFEDEIVFNLAACDISNEAQKALWMAQLEREHANNISMFNVRSYEDISRYESIGVVKHTMPSCRKREDKQFWSGQTVRVSVDGVSRIFLGKDEPPLELFGGRQMYRQSRIPATPVTIHFWKDKVILQHDGRILYQRSIDAMQRREQPGRWKLQVTKELANNAFNGKQTLSKILSQDTPLPQTRSSRALRKNRDFKALAIKHGQTPACSNTATCLSPDSESFP